MKNILVLGAGRSSSSLIKYFLDYSIELQWQVTVGDMSLELAKQKTGNHPNARAIGFDVNNQHQREDEISKADIVVSMLPASMHIDVARDCVRLKKHLATASYVSKYMAALDAEAKSAGIILMNEVGLDPGIDHASAMKVIDNIHDQGGHLTSFKSYCGGLIAPEYNDNPWGYKFTWNPRNVVLAGQGTAQYIQDGKYRYIPYNRIFTQIEHLHIPVKNAEGIESDIYFEGYANRDSLSYRKMYNIPDIPTMLRGTLRMPGYCKAWNVLVKLGLTDDTFTIENPSALTYRELVEAYLPLSDMPVADKLKSFMSDEADDEALKKIEWLGLLANTQIITSGVVATPAKILQDLLEIKWKLKEQDKDMIVMQHLFEYTMNGTSKSITSSLIVKGQDQSYTAMAKTVGLPLAIITKLILQNTITDRGVLIPVKKEIYQPLLKELEEMDVKFVEKEM